VTPAPYTVAAKAAAADNVEGYTIGKQSGAAAAAVDKVQGYTIGKQSGRAAAAADNVQGYTVGKQSWGAAAAARETSEKQRVEVLDEADPSEVGE